MIIPTKIEDKKFHVVIDNDGWRYTLIEYKGGRVFELIHVDNKLSWMELHKLPEVFEETIPPIH
jgi:hypothetical protein